MTPAARIAAVIEILQDMPDGQLAGQGLRAGMQRRRYAGSGDRAAISALFWQIQRARARIGWHLDAIAADISPRNQVIAALVMIDQQYENLTHLFTDAITHAPPALNDNELVMATNLAKRTFDDAKMPVHVALEWPEFLLEDARIAISRVIDDKQSVEAELAALLDEAPTDLRINPIKLDDRRLLRDRLAGRGIKCYATSLSPWGVRLAKRTRTDELQEWKKGQFDIQDEGSQIAALLCDARPGMQVADVCAGAGGKSLVMAARMQNKGRVLAIDSSAERLERSGERLRRAGIHNVERKAVDDKWGTRKWRAKFDRVVIDAPCSGSGTWRRQVDARWRLTPDILARYQAAQQGLLEKARAMVLPGGRIIYITCSLLASECEAQITTFLADAPELEMADIGDIWDDTIGRLKGGTCPQTATLNASGMLRLLPRRDNTDGFFIAIIQARLR
ncbi:RsmB/NOP family class I SAM-dependent RNA methyltransferase [Candidatus Puniceispirillum sp.]|uniref:RsmB/NOP family class I SAM-dependent RNA methyltransferase n=1 Tax=Candidatus Puniceispirillum sp. TaxID=2026719 RepID=UPI003F695F62